MCGGDGGGDAIIGRRKSHGVAIKTIDSFCPQLLDTDSKTDKNSLLLLLRTNVLHPFFYITSLRSLLRHFLSNCPHEILFNAMDILNFFCFLRTNFCPVGGKYCPLSECKLYAKVPQPFFDTGTLRESDENYDILSWGDSIYSHPCSYHLSILESQSMP